MGMRGLRLFFPVFLAGCVSPAHQVSTTERLPPAAESYRGRFGVGVGFTSGPSTLALDGDLAFPVREDFTVGPHSELGVSSHRTLWANTISAEHEFRLRGEAPELDRVRPFVRGGLGFAYLADDRRAGNDDDIGLLVNVGGGVRYNLDDRTSLGSGMLLNFLPGDVLGERFFFSWELVQLEFRF